jgi:hypothetical protein
MVKKRQLLVFARDELVSAKARIVMQDRIWKTLSV